MGVRGTPGLHQQYILIHALDHQQNLLEPSLVFSVSWRPRTVLCGCQAFREAYHVGLSSASRHRMVHNQAKFCREAHLRHLSSASWLQSRRGRANLCGEALLGNLSSASQTVRFAAQFALHCSSLRAISYHRKAHPLSDRSWVKASPAAQRGAEAAR